jgi:hypothetical protein
MLEYKSCYDIETGFFNKEIGIQDEDKNEDEDEINDNFVIIPQHSMRETNTKLFKLMEKSAYIMLEDLNIVEYFVYEERKSTIFNKYVIKYYLRHKNNIFYKVEKKYDLYTQKSIENSKITEYDTLNELIYYDNV